MLSNSKGSPFFFGVFFIQGERNQRTLEVCVGPTEPINTNVQLGSCNWLYFFLVLTTDHPFYLHPYKLLQSIKRIDPPKYVLTLKQTCYANVTLSVQTCEERMVSQEIVPADKDCEDDLLTLFISTMHLIHFYTR